MVAAQALLCTLAIDEPISPTKTGATFSLISQPHISFMRLTQRRASC